MSQKVFNLAQLAELTKTNLVGDPSHVIHHVADLETASPEDASFLANPNYDKAMRASKAGVVFVAQGTELVPGRNFLIAENPSRDFQDLVELIFGESVKIQSGFSGIHPTSVIHPTATIGKGATIGPHAVVDKDAVIGNNTTVSSGAYIGYAVRVGNDTFIHPNVTIRERCILGDRVIIQPGAVIGSCGFGYITDKTGKHVKLNQVGIVIIEDDVEIGANTTIDRSRFKATVIKKGTKIDNLVQIGHGAEIGSHNIIVAQCGIAGSSTTGSYVVMGGQSAIAGHLSVADGTMIAGKSGVSKTIVKSGKYGGVPCMPIADYNRNSVHLRNIENYVDRIKQLEERLSDLEKSTKDR